MNKSNFQLHSFYINIYSINLSWLNDTNYEYMYRRKWSFIKQIPGNCD